MTEFLLITIGFVLGGILGWDLGYYKGGSDTMNTGKEDEDSEEWFV